MGIDKETGLKWCTITIEKNSKLLKKLEENNIANSSEEEHKEKPELWFNDDIGKIECDEYYFEESDGCLHYSGNCQTLDGEICLNFDLPLSDVVLIDILQHSIKKLNKLKTAMETLR